MGAPVFAPDNAVVVYTHGEESGTDLFASTVLRQRRAGGGAWPLVAGRITRVRRSARTDSRLADA